MAALGQPVELVGLELRNRFVMAPMTRMQSPGGVPTADVAEYYARRAAHVGLIMTEGVQIDHSMAGFYPNAPRIHTAEALAGWSAVVQAVRAEGAKIVPQLWHVGGSTGPDRGNRPFLTPSGLDLDLRQVEGAVTATQQDIDDVVASYGRAAGHAKALGFDGISVHGGHGYLLDSFAWEATNRRSDHYGGSIASRMRLAAEVVAHVRSVVGSDFPVFYRFSQWKVDHYDAKVVRSAAELEAFLTPLIEAGVDVFDVSTRRIWEPAFDGSPRSLAGWTRKVSGLPVIAVGSVGVTSPLNSDERDLRGHDFAHVAELFDSGEFDLLAVGRAQVSDPAWVSKVLEGRFDEIRPYEKSHEGVSPLI